MTIKKPCCLNSVQTLIIKTSNSVLLLALRILSLFVASILFHVSLLICTPVFVVSILFHMSLLICTPVFVVSILFHMSLLICTPVFGASTLFHRSLLICTHVFVVSIMFHRSLLICTPVFGASILFSLRSLRTLFFCSNFLGVYSSVSFSPFARFLSFFEPF